MDPSSWSYLFFYFLLIAFSAYFSASEMAFSSVGKIKLLSLKDEGKKNADLAIHIAEKYDFYLTTILVGNNLVNSACAAVATIFSAHVYLSLKQSGADVTQAVVTTVATAVTTILVFLFAEALPKNYAKDNCDRVALSFAGSLRLISVVLFPVTVLFMGFSKLFGKIVRSEEEPTVTEEELCSIIETSEEEGVLDEDQSELLQSALEFSKTRVADVLTMRADVEWIEIHSSKEEILAQVSKTRYSRLPVCDGSFDSCIGILIVNDFLKAVIAGTYVRLSKLIRKPFFTTLDASIDDLKDEMSGKRQHLALVRDREEKSLIGIVTMEDFVEELVGEIYDENDVVDDDFEKLGGNYFRVSGRLPVAELYRRIHMPVPNNLNRKPVSTWILECLGRIPEEEDEFTVGELTVAINETEQNRVLFATVKKADPRIDISETEEDNGEEQDK